MSMQLFILDLLRAGIAIAAISALETAIQVVSMEKHKKGRNEGQALRRKHCAL